MHFEPGGHAEARFVSPAPRHDDFRRAQVIGPGAEVNTGGVLASREPGERLPSCFTGTNAGTVCYQRPAGPAATGSLTAFSTWNGTVAAAAASREVGGVLVEIGSARPAANVLSPEGGSFTES